MLSLHLNEWLECKCKSATQSVGFLYRVGPFAEKVCNLF